MSSQSPVCKGFYRTLNKHLKHRHAVRNLEERAILLNMAQGRVNIRKVPCPQPECSYAGGRMDRHASQQHRELSHHERHQLLPRLKHDVTLQLLRELRERKPTIAMVTMLDKGGSNVSPRHPPSVRPPTYRV
ncbi:hypothetical protein KUCAC02_016530 [Chaenocephalus aceratus]|nr:hypothetical protein KUCAC02_016530 [Chaenocephalus aceratus]